MGAGPTRPPVARAADSEQLLQQLRGAATYSCVYVPFLHAVIGSDGSEAGEYAAAAAGWAAHDAAWAPLVAAYRTFFEGRDDLAALLDSAAVRGALWPRWPYIPAGAATDEPAGLLVPWPLQSATLGYTQEGLLSQAPLLFQQLMQMIVGWLAEGPPA